MVRSFAQRGCVRQYRLSRSEVQRLMWCMFVPALRVCAALHLHQSQRNTAGSGQKIRSIVWRKLSSLYAADVQGIVRCVKMCVERLFKSTATNHPGDDDGFDPVIDTRTNLPIATISFDALVDELRNGDAWNEIWAKRCWTTRHIKFVTNGYESPDRQEFFDGKNLWCAKVSENGSILTEPDSWLVSGGKGTADESGNHYAVQAVGAAVKDVERNLSNLGTVSFWFLCKCLGARPLRGLLKLM